MMHIFFYEKEALCRFFSLIDHCSSPIWISEDGAHAEELRANRHVQSLLLAHQNQKTSIKIQAQNTEDSMRILRFMIENGEKRKACCA